MMDEHRHMQQDAGLINIKRLLAALWRRAWLVVLSAILFAALIFMGTYFLVTPLYQASAMFYVNNGSVSVGDSGVRISSGDINASKSLVETYIVILNTRETLNEVNGYAGTNYGYSTLRDMIEAEAVNETEIFRVVVTSPNPDEAERIANAIVAVLPERISNIVEGSLAKVVDPAVRPTGPSSPSYINNILLSFLLGAVFGAGLIIVQEFLSIAIREEEDVTQVCKYPILAAIPDMTVVSKGDGYYGYGGEKKKTRGETPTVILGSNSSFAASEAYNLLRTNLQYSFADEEACRVIGVSSAISGEGKSVSAINLAYSLTQLGKRVLLIDCDMRKPTIAEKLKLQKKPGLSGLLTGQCSLTDVVQTYRIDERKKRSFYAIAAGQTPPNPIELLSSHRMSVVLQAFRQSFDYVILDLPPVCEVSDALAVKQIIDGVLFVVRQDRCNRIVLKDALRKFEYVNAKILGVVYNSVNANGSKYGYSNRYYKKHSTKT